MAHAQNDEAEQSGFDDEDQSIVGFRVAGPEEKAGAREQLQRVLGDTLERLVVVEAYPDTKPEPVRIHVQ